MIKAVGITHYYNLDLALENINFEAKKGEFVTLVGESGSGKSTLLSILSSLLKPTHGELFFEGRDFKTIKDIDAFRRNEISFIFQFHYLISYLTILENIQLASVDKNSPYIEELLKKLGIDEIKHKYADEISGGQRQRAAVARSLVNKPKILFADEPTGNLDSKNSKNVYEIFKELSNGGMTIISATHDRELAHYSHKIIEVKDGKIF